MRLVKLGLIGMTSLGLAATAFQANATDFDGDASANIEEPLIITQDTAMDFATIQADSTGDTITLTLTDAVLSPGASTFSGTPASADFSVTGTPNAAVTISFSSGDTLSGPGAPMTLGNFQNDAGTTPQIDGTGNFSVTVGADLTVNANQVGGAYSGTYTLTIDYN